MEKKEKNTILLLSITSLVTDHVNFTRRTPIRKEKKKTCLETSFLGWNVPVSVHFFFPLKSTFFACLFFKSQ